uniref:C-type lectin domain-containing protein n=1 Tax=Xiphophorus maculatus TaxID=8083 RepID=A0A3B5PX11_XIPMA
MQQADIFRQDVAKEREASSLKIMELEAEKKHLIKELTAFQKLNSGCEFSFKMEKEKMKSHLQDGNEFGPPGKNMAKCQKENEKDTNSISDSAAKNQDHHLEETLEEDIDVPHTSNREENPEYVLVNEPRSWSDAQKYCRQNFRDLATIRNHTENQRAQSLLPSPAFVWIGLFRDPNFHWSDGSRFVYRNWAKVFNIIGSNRIICGVTWSPGQWRFRSCETKRSFVCHSLPGNFKCSFIFLV